MKKKQALVVTTKHRGVFFGYYESNDGSTFNLTGARNCVYWSEETKGFIGLAVSGPASGSKVGPKCEALQLFDVTSALVASDDAIAAWEKDEWT